MAVEYEGGVVIGADSRTSSGYVDLGTTAGHVGLGTTAGHVDLGTIAGHVGLGTVPRRYVSSGSDGLCVHALDITQKLGNCLLL